ncbi:hypothetical protein [Micromonospora sp. CPCC 205556]|uniref:hypothetical protein n=1 Tax=Micromonospora sp. CPCC 205556 TaxID=3122398 RepID=UPI002FF2DBDA
MGVALVGACPPLREPYTLGVVVDGVREGVGSVSGLRLSDLGGALRIVGDGAPPLIVGLLTYAGSGSARMPDDILGPRLIMVDPPGAPQLTERRSRRATGPLSPPGPRKKGTPGTTRQVCSS